MKELAVMLSDLFYGLAKNLVGFICMMVLLYFIAPSAAFYLSVLYVKAMIWSFFGAVLFTGLTYDSNNRESD